MTAKDYRGISLQAVRSELASGGETQLHIQGRSMAPWLLQGDVVVVRAVQPTELKFGDILVTCRGEDLVTHRLVARDANGWYTKGDGLSYIDPPVPARAILGRVEAMERKGILYDLSYGWSQNAHRIIAWLSLLEGSAYRRYAALIGRRSTGAGWAARILSLPFRLPVWLLTVFRR